MKTRKLVLIIADVILLGVCIIQGILAAHDGAKYFQYKEEADEITVTTPSETMNFVLEGENWVMNQQKYPAMGSIVQNFVSSMEYIRALDKVGTLNDSTVQKYEFDEGHKITVETKKAGKVLRTIEIGKEATASSQAYITVDGGKDIYLASGSLRATFNKTMDDLRSKVVWGLDTDTISSVSLEKSDGTKLSLSRMGSGDDLVWNMSGTDSDGVEIDESKSADWFSSVSIVTTNGWLNDNTKAGDLGGTLKVTAKVVHDYKTAVISIYEIPAEAEGAENSYYGTSSETPYVFNLASYQFDKFNKTAEEFAK